jgi:hypothetical protein
VNTIIPAKQSVLKRAVAVGFAGVLIAGLASPVWAAGRYHRSAQPVPQSQLYGYAPGPAVGSRAYDRGPLGAYAQEPLYGPPSAIARPYGAGPNECWTDEGYGRFTSCN